MSVRDKVLFYNTWIRSNSKVYDEEKTYIRVNPLTLKDGSPCYYFHSYKIFVYFPGSGFLSYSSYLDSVPVNHCLTPPYGREVEVKILTNKGTHSFTVILPKGNMKMKKIVISTICTSSIQVSVSIAVHDIVSEEHSFSCTLSV